MRASSYTVTRPANVPLDRLFDVIVAEDVLPVRIAWSGYMRRCADRCIDLAIPQSDGSARAA